MRSAAPAPPAPLEPPVGSPVTDPSVYEKLGLTPTRPAFTPAPAPPRAAPSAPPPGKPVPAKPELAEPEPQKPAPQKPEPQKPEPPLTPVVVTGSSARPPAPKPPPPAVARPAPTVPTATPRIPKPAAPVATLERPVAVVEKAIEVTPQADEADTERASLAARVASLPRVLLDTVAWGGFAAVVALIVIALSDVGMGRAALWAVGLSGIVVLAVAVMAVTGTHLDDLSSASDSQERRG